MEPTFECEYLTSSIGDVKNVYLDADMLQAFALTKCFTVGGALYMMTLASTWYNINISGF